MLADPELLLVVRLLVAAAAGLLVGVEREWSGKTAGPDARFAGVRTFSLLGFLGGLSGWLLAGTWPAAGVALLAAATALCVAAYVIAVRQPQSTVDGTTETAALVVLALGVLAGLGYLRVTSGAAALVALVLAEKSRVRRLLARLDEGELRAALVFAVLAFVVLPLLPDRRVGPFGGVNPRALWLVVLLFSGLNFLGYVARQVVGAERGYGVTGLLGGLVSSTAVTLHFSRQSRRDPELSAPLALGVLAACTVLLPRVMVVSLLLNPAVALRLLPVLGPPFLVGAALIAMAVLRHGPEASSASPAESHSPLGLGAAIQMAVVLQLVLLLVQWMQRVGGSGGVLATAAVVGLTDTDAITLAMNRLGADPTQVGLAATAIGVAVLSNTAMKAVLALALGSSAFRRVAALGLGALGAATVLGIWLGGR